ncbi:hypothetical protein LPJ55_003154 [Coemansia sp. RSA 990]|nr:hypothetical protein LPJ55_003154 [Coemansia sp. RSA 990]
MSTTGIPQSLRHIDVDKAIQLIAQAQSCVLLVGSKVSAELGLTNALDHPTIRAAIDKPAGGDTGSDDNDTLSTISNYCGQLTATQAPGIRRLVTDLTSSQKLVRVYTDDVHTAVLVPPRATAELYSDIESRTICIHGRVTHFVCQACTAKSQLTQAVLFKAMNGKEVMCGVCGTMGSLAKDAHCHDVMFIPDVLRCQENENMALELAQTDSADLLLVLGADEEVSEAWAAVASVLSHSATHILVIGLSGTISQVLVEGKTLILREQETTFVQQYVDSKLDMNGVDQHSTDSMFPAIAEMALVEASSTAESSDDRSHLLSRPSSDTIDLSIQQKGSRRSKNRNREKTNLNHLLNFTLPERVPMPAVRPRRRVAEGAVSERQAEINRSMFINANFRFVLKPRFWSNFIAVATRPDMQIRFEWIERIIMPVTGEATSCPICLSHPVAARVTKCGHIFCFSCILRHLSYNEEDDRRDAKCPICWSAISADTLLPVHFWAVQYDTSCAAKPSGGYLSSSGTKLAPNTHITMQLMKRLRGSTICLPRSSSACLYTASLVNWFKNAEDASRSPVLDSSHFPWTFSDGALAFARFMLATRNYCKDEYQRELRELQESKDMDVDVESKLFMESAIMSVEEALARAQPDAPEDKWEAKAMSQQLQAVPNECSDSAIADDDFMYFYQADDGQHIYMHPLHMRILAQGWGSYAKLPNTLEIRLRRSVESMVTDEVRKQSRFLDHLSLRCELVIVEPELKGIVSPKTLQKFRLQLSHHEKHHAARERSMALEEARTKVKYSAMKSARQGYEGIYGYNDVISQAPDSTGEPDANSFPALGDTKADGLANGTAEQNYNSKRDSLWPREPLPNGAGGMEPYNEVWEEFEKAIGSSRSPRSSYEYESGGEHYEHGIDDFSVQPKGAGTPKESADASNSKNMFSNLPTPTTNDEIKPLYYTCHAWRTAALGLMFSRCNAILGKRVAFEFSVNDSNPQITNCLGSHFSQYVKTIYMTVDYASLVNGFVLSRLESIYHSLYFVNAYALTVNVNIEDSNTTGGLELTGVVGRTVSLIKDMVPSLSTIQICVTDDAPGSEGAEYKQLESLFSGMTRTVSSSHLCINHPCKQYIVKSCIPVSNLTTLFFVWDSNHRNLTQIMHANCEILQHVQIFFTSFEGLEKLVYDEQGDPVVYSHLILMRFHDRGAGAIEPKIKTEMCAPFPRLRLFHCMVKYPFDDDTIFRGNYNLMENLYLTADFKIICMLNGHGLLAKGRMKSLRKLMIADSVVEIDNVSAVIDTYMGLIGNVLPNLQALRAIDADISDALIVSLTGKTQFENLQLLSLYCSFLTLSDIVRLLKSLPHLHTLANRISGLGKDFRNSNALGIAEVLRAKFNPLNKYFRKWHITNTVHFPENFVIASILLIADICPGLKTVIIENQTAEVTNQTFKKLVGSKLYADCKEKFTAKLQSVKAKPTIFITHLCE